MLAVWARVLRWVDLQLSAAGEELTIGQRRAQLRRATEGVEHGLQSVGSGGSEGLDAVDALLGEVKAMCDGLRPICPKVSKFVGWPRSIQERAINLCMKLVEGGSMLPASGLSMFPLPGPSREALGACCTAAT